MKPLGRSLHTARHEVARVIFETSVPVPYPEHDTTRITLGERTPAEPKAIRMQASNTEEVLRLEEQRLFS